MQAHRRNVFSHVPATKVREVSHMLKAIHAQKTRTTAEAKASAVVDELRRQRMGRAADLVDAHVAEDPDLLRLPGLPMPSIWPSRSSEHPRVGHVA